MVPLDTVGKGYKTVKQLLWEMKFSSTTANVYSWGRKHEGLEWNCVYCCCYQRLLIVFTDADGPSCVIAFFKGMSVCQLQLSQHPPGIIQGSWGGQDGVVTEPVQSPAAIRARLSSEPEKTCRHNWNKKPLCSNQRLFFTYLFIIVFLLTKTLVVTTEISFLDLSI